MIDRFLQLIDMIDRNKYQVRSLTVHNCTIVFNYDSSVVIENQFNQQFHIKHHSERGFLQ